MEEQHDDPAAQRPESKAGWREKLESAKEWFGSLKDRLPNVDPRVVEALRLKLATTLLAPVREKVRFHTSDIRKKLLWIFGAVAVALVATGYFTKMEVFYWSAYSFVLSLVILLVVVSMVQTRVLKVIEDVHDRVVGSHPAEG